MAWRSRDYRHRRFAKLPALFATGGSASYAIAADTAVTGRIADLTQYGR
jgi:hypothetical protein